MECAIYDSPKIIFFSLIPGPTKNWIAVEGSPSHSSATDSIPLANYSYKIASSAPRGPQLTDERNVFAIYVSYYIKVKLALSGMGGGEVTLKLPFILGHIDDSLDDNQDHHDDDVVKKLDNKIESNTAANYSNDVDDSKPKRNVESSTSDVAVEVNSCKKNCINNDGDVNVIDTGELKGIKTIDKCRNGNGLSIDVIVEDLSDGKNDVNNGDALESSRRTRGNCNNETERTINVVTAQVHSSAV